jgi:large subunit ribosomal protein L15
MPLHRRIPKRGFHNPGSKEFSVVNIETLNAFPAGETVTPELLRAHGMVRRAVGEIKILGDGELKVALTVHAHAFSASAREKIAAAGGKVERVS